MMYMPKLLYNMKTYRHILSFDNLMSNQMSANIITFISPKSQRENESIPAISLNCSAELQYHQESWSGANRATFFKGRTAIVKRCRDPFLRRV
ncbi:hypothetical protein D3C71_1708720 [compost metagenome]